MLSALPRHGLALAATALAAVAMALGVAGRGCGGEDESPDGAVRAFAAAARAGDRETMLELLGPASRQWLDRAAHRASQMVGGQARYSPLDLLGAGALAAGPSRIIVRERNGDAAVVDVVDALGNRSAIRAVRVAGRWRLELADELAEAGP